MRRFSCVEGILRSEPIADANRAPEWNRVSDHAKTAREQILRCRGITQHFLRLSSGKSSQTALVDLRASFEAVVPLITPIAKTRSVQIDVVPPSPDARVRVNDSELQQVLLNLLLNAVQACDLHGHVRLEALPGDPPRIRVVDDGRGIAAEDMKRVFEPFFSLRDEGTGLGLFLSLTFVRRWGGEIFASSVVGKGSTFEVQLPPLEGRETGLEAAS